MSEPTNIKVIPRTAEVLYDHSKTLLELQSYKTDTINPYGAKVDTITQGFMRGRIGMRHKITLGLSKNKHYSYGCLWYDTIEIELIIDPVIMIAKEIYEDDCMRKAVIGHELKHITVDREIVNKYARSMGKQVHETLKLRGFVVGPVSLAQIENTSTNMQKLIEQVLMLEYQKLGLDRRIRQIEVDSRDEYDRVESLCPAFKEKLERLHRKIPVR